MIINSVSPLSCQQKNSRVECKFQLKMQNYAYLCTHLKSRWCLKCTSGQEILFITLILLQFILISSLQVSFSPYLYRVAVVFSVRFSVWLWLFWLQRIGRDYNELLHWPLKAQLIVFAKLGIHLPGRCSYLLYFSALSFSFPGEYLLLIRKKSGTWQTDCSDLLFW